MMIPVLKFFCDAYVSKQLVDCSDFGIAHPFGRMRCDNLTQWKTSGGGGHFKVKKLQVLKVFRRANRICHGGGSLTHEVRALRDERPKVHAFAAKRNADQKCDIQGVFLHRIDPVSFVNSLTTVLIKLESNSIVYQMDKLVRLKRTRCRVRNNRLDKSCCLKSTCSVSDNHDAEHTVSTHHCTHAFGPRRGFIHYLRIKRS